ncbi:MAG: hypothetical protein NC313_05525 [Butyrivibrio sp.]|nr:hypothetical protein [Butyrivibrio sp.]
MGISINLEVSESVTEKEWSKVYEESLELVKAFPLAERGTISYAGHKVVCAVRTSEREIHYCGRIRRGWRAEMDYDTLNMAEGYCLFKDFVDSEGINRDAGDAIMGVLPNLDFMDYDWQGEKYRHTHSLWGDKTQGEPYHMYLLSIACMIEDRLGEKVFIHGDITQGQCREAVEMANQYLKNPIRIPARCDMERLYERIRKLPLNENEKIEVFEFLYLGNRDETFYDFIRAHFNADIIQAYWEKRFAGSMIGTIGFIMDLKAYLSSGAGLEELCSIVRMEDGEGNPQYEKFIYALMDSKLHIKEKNTEDYLDIQQENEQPYSIWEIMANFVYGGAHNRKAERYIPIDEIRQALRSGLGDKCNTDRYIDQYLAKEAAAPEIDFFKENIAKEEMDEMIDADPAEVFTQCMDKRMEGMQDLREQYDNLDYDDLIDYREGNTIVPPLKEAVVKSFQFYNKVTREKKYKGLMKKSHEERCIFLIERNDQLLLKDKDWMHIFANMEQHPENYERYYPMVRVEADKRSLNLLVIALVLNDDLYESAKEWSKEYEVS